MKVLNSKGVCPKCLIHFPSKLRIHANFCFANVIDFSHYLPKPDLLNCIIKPRTFDKTLLSEFPFFSHEGLLSEKEILIVDRSQNHIDIINEFKAHHKKKFILIYSNINSVFNKVHELEQILDKCNSDAFLIDESKLDCLVHI